jgi:O-antigen/teichoic acid export membrane protein
LNPISYNFGIAALSRLIIGGISLVVVGLLTRYLGPSGYGNYSLILAYLYIFTALADLGLNTVLVREISREGADEKYITGNIFTLRLICSVFFLTLGIIISLSLNYPLQIKIGIAIASLFAIFSSLSQVIIGVFQKYLRVYYVSVADIIARAIQLLLLLLLVRAGTGFITFIWLLVFSEAIHFLMIMLLSNRIIPIKLEFDFNYWWKIIKNSLPIAVSLVFVLLYFKMDTVLLSLMKPASDVGIYSVAYKILEVIIFLPALYIGLIMPTLSRHAFGSREEFIKTYRQSFDILSIFAIPAMVFIYLRATDIIRIVGGSGYGQSVDVLKVLSVAIMLIFFGNLAGNALVALNLQKKGMWVYFIGAIFNVGANLLLIPRFSFMATAWTTVLTEFAITLLLFILIKKQTGASVKFNVMLRVIAASLIIFFILSFFHFGFITFCLLSILYFPVLFIFRGFTVADFKAVIFIRSASGPASD